jgi:protein SCO1
VERIQWISRDAEPRLDMTTIRTDKEPRMNTDETRIMKNTDLRHPCFIRVHPWLSPLASLCVPLCSLWLISVLLFPSSASAESPPPGYEGAAVIEKPDARVPLDVTFYDEDGKPVRLGDYFRSGKPVLLNMVYLRCPMLCNLTLNGQVKALRPLALVPGRDFQIVTVSFDPREKPELAAAKKASYIRSLGKPEAAAGWHFLTSDRPSAAEALGQAIGFGFKLDPKGQNYLHQSAIYICAPDGRVARTIQGVEFAPDMLGDSLIHASQGKISRGLFGVALSCGLFHYDADTGRYTWAAVAIMRVTGILTVLVLAAGIGVMLYRDARKKNVPLSLRERAG